MIGIKVTQVRDDDSRIRLEISHKIFVRLNFKGGGISLEQIKKGQKEKTMDEAKNSRNLDETLGIIETFGIKKLVSVSNSNFKSHLDLVSVSSQHRYRVSVSSETLLPAPSPFFSKPMNIFRAYEYPPRLSPCSSSMGQNSPNIPTFDVIFESPVT